MGEQVFSGDDESSRSTRAGEEKNKTTVMKFCVYIYYTLACFSMVRVGGMTLPFSRSAGCIMSGCKWGGRSGRMCPVTRTSQIQLDYSF